jgi:phage/plasmid-like protein (TIGR03299 family)
MENLNQQTFELLDSTGLNWTVNKEELFSGDGKATESYGIFRNDTREWLGTVGSKYTPMQNYELAETILQATDGIGLVTNRGGSLANGAKIYLQAALPDEYIGKSSIKRNITALNSHDGSSSIGFGSSSTVVVCQNTFFMAYKELDKFKHTLNFRDRVDNAMQELRKALQLDQSLMDNFKRMADVKLNDSVTERIIRKLFAVEPMTAKSAVSTRKLNQVTAFANSLEKEINLEGETLWGLFNAVTRYTNHVASPKDEDKKLDYLMNGGGYRLSNMGYAEIMAWMEKNVAKKEFVFMGA